MLVKAAGGVELEELPADRAVDFAVEVDAVGAGHARRRCAGSSRKERSGCPERAGRVLANAVVAVEGDGQHVGHAFADRTGQRAVHAADHAPRQAVAVLVEDDVGVEIAVALQRRRVDARGWSRGAARP